MIKAVIFDMDGLMIDSEILGIKVYGNIMKKSNIQLSKHEYGMCFAGKTIHNGLAYAKEYYHLDFDIEEAVQSAARDMEELMKNTIIELKPGLLELISFLKSKNIKIAIASSSNIERIHTLLDSYQLLDLFDEIICGTHVKNGKPAPDIFLKACERLQVEPLHALVLEDSEAGIQAAFNAHIPVICIPDIKYPDPKYQAMSTAVYESLFDVIDFLENEL